MIEEDLITYETAVLAKSKGFDLETLHFYTKPNTKMFGIDEHRKSYSIKNISKKLYQCGQQAVLNIENVFYASSHSLLAKWLRVNHNIHINIRYEEYFSKVNYKYFHFDISHRIFNDVTKNQDLFYDLMDECSQDIPGNYVNDEKFSKLIFERNFAFSTYEECFEYALQEALKLI